MTLIRKRQHRPDREDRKSFKAMRLHRGMSLKALARQANEADPSLNLWHTTLQRLEGTGYVSEEKALAILKACFDLESFDALREAAGRLPSAKQGNSDEHER